MRQPAKRPHLNLPTMSIKASFPEQLCTITGDSANNRLLPFSWGLIRLSASEVTASGFRKITEMFFFFLTENVRVNEFFNFFLRKSSYYTFRGMWSEVLTGGLVSMSVSLFAVTVARYQGDSPTVGPSEHL